MRDAVHTYCSPLTGRFYNLSETDKHLMETFVKKEITGAWTMSAAVDQFANRQLRDWRNNSRRATKLYVQEKRKASFLPKCMNEVAWSQLVEEERNKLSGLVPKSQQQLLADARMADPEKHVTSCFGAAGRAGFASEFQPAYVRAPTEAESEWVRLHKGKWEDNVTEYWNVFEITPLAKLEAFGDAEDMYAFYIESGYKEDEADAQVVQRLANGTATDHTRRFMVGLSKRLVAKYYRSNIETN